MIKDQDNTTYPTTSTTFGGYISTTYTLGTTYT